jgi:hypothetical protein
MPSKVMLRIVRGVSDGKKLSIDQRTTCIIGRSKDCCLVLSKRKHSGIVSRHHCMLRIDPPRAWIRDLGSLNGTYLNGVKIGQRVMDQSPPAEADAEFGDHELFHGDQIKVGNTVIEFTTYVPKVCMKCRGEISEESEITAYQEGLSFLCFVCKQEVDARLAFILEKEIAKARRYGTPLSALGFSPVRFESKDEAPPGSVSNQALMAAIHQRIATILRDSDIMGQFGISRVVVLMPMTPSDGAEIALRRYLSLIHSQPVDVDGISVNVKMTGVMTCFDMTFKGDVGKFLEAISKALFQMETKIGELPSARG